MRQLADIANDLVDERFGIVRFVVDQPQQPGGPRFFRFLAQAANTRAFTLQENFGAAGGASTDRATALAKAIGEAVERYCAAVYDLRALPLCAYDDAPFPCVEPERFALFTPEQLAQPGFPYVPFTRGTPVRWTPARDALTGEPCHLPAAVVYVPYTYYTDQGEPPIAQPISTGLSCHSTLARAALGGLCEVIERDAFMITWQCRWPRRQVRLETLPPELLDLVQRFTDAGRRVTLFDLGVDTRIPTLLAVQSSDRPNVPALVFSAAAAPDPRTGARKALEELAHTEHFVTELIRGSRLPTNPLDFDAVVEQDDHVKIWAHPVLAPQADFLWTSPERIDLEDLPDLSTGSDEGDLCAVVERVRHTGHQVLLADLTTAEVRELGLSVIRAVVPGFHPLAMGWRYRCRGGRRLYEVPGRLGFDATACGFDNPLPHPYP